MDAHCAVHTEEHIYQSFVLIAFEGDQMNVTANNIEIIIIFHLNRMPYNDDDNDNNIYLLYWLLLALHYIRILCNSLLTEHSMFEQNENSATARARATIRFLAVVLNSAIHFKP